MASISRNQRNGTKRILFIGVDGKRDAIRLGNLPMKTAETIKIHIENLLSAQITSTSVVSETAQWLAKIDDQLHQKLADKKLVPPRRVVGTLGENIGVIRFSRSGNGTFIFRTSFVVVGRT